MDKIVVSKESSDKIDAIYSSIMEHFGKKSADKILNETFSLIKHASYYPGLGKIYRDNIRYLDCQQKNNRILSS